MSAREQPSWRIISPVRPIAPAPKTIRAGFTLNSKDSIAVLTLHHGAACPGPSPTLCREEEYSCRAAATARLTETPHRACRRGAREKDLARQMFRVRLASPG